MRVAALASALVAGATHAAAHDGTHLQTATSFWDALAMTFTVGGGLLYVAGVWRLMRRGVHLPVWQHAAFVAGSAALLTAVAPPLDARATLRFSAHMIQHELLVLIGAPLIVAARPIVPWLWGLPGQLRAAAGATLRSSAVGGPWRTLTHPLVACVLYGATLWTWHVPSLYESAVLNEAVHALQHAMFFGTAVLFWWGLLYGRYGRAAYGASVVFVFATMVHSGALGALFAFSSAPFYGVYVDRAAAAGVDASMDQQLGGLYMWIPAGIALTFIGVALLLAWMAEGERRVRGHRPNADPQGPRHSRRKNVA
jgi:putative membrane protein